MAIYPEEVWISREPDYVLLAQIEKEIDGRLLDSRSSMVSKLTWEWNELIVGLETLGKTEVHVLLRRYTNAGWTGGTISANETGIVFTRR